MTTIARTGRRAVLGGLTAAVLALTTAPATAQEWPPNACPPAVPTAEIVDGLVGTGLTVERGTVPEPFTATVLGRIADGIAPGLDLIIAELDSPALQRVGGMWAGMSGSPVYADDGRLIGAVSYGLSFGPSRVAGLTPAADMLALLDGGGPGPSGRDRVNVPEELQRRLVEQGAAPAAAAEQGMTRLPLPLGVSGGQLGGHRDQVLERLALPGTRPYVAGQAAPIEGDPAEIFPGSNFAAALSYGDFSSVGVGTTTAVCGNEGLAFGHPFLFSGPSSMSVHPADAVYVQEDPTLMPFKVANPGPVVGTLDRDRLAGVHALLGIAPETIPVTSTVRVGDASRTGETFVTVPDLLPDLALLAVLTNSDRLYDRFAGGRSSVHYTVTGTREGGPPWTLERSNRFANLGDISVESVFELAGDLAAVQDNRFAEVAITGVAVDTVIDPTYLDFAVDQVLLSVEGAPYEPLTPDQPLTVAPGSTLDLRVVLSPYKNRAPARTVDLPLVVPESAAGSGELLIAGGGGEGGFDPGPGPRPEATSFEDLLDQVAGAPHNDDVSAALTLFGGPGDGEEPPFDPDGPEPVASATVRAGDVVRGAFAVPVDVVASVAVTRLGGADRYDTSVRISQDLYGPDEAGAVVLARGDDFADGLAGVPFAAARNAPLLLTPPVSLDARVAAEIDRVLPTGGTVHLLGGTTAVSSGVEEAVEGMGYHVERIAGATRYHTAVAVAEATTPDPDVVLVATGTNFPDALAAGAAAAGVGVVVLTDDVDLPSATASYLDETDGAVIAVGAPAASAAAGYAPAAYVGGDRYATAALVAGDFFGPFAERVGIASGLSFPDALGGGVHAAAHGGPVLLTRKDSLPGASAGYLAEFGDGVGGAFLYGSTDVVTDAVRDQVASLLGAAG